MAKERVKRWSRFAVELVLGQRNSGMYLPKNTGNFLSFRIKDGDSEIGIVEIGGGSIFWKPYRNRRYGTSFRRNWSDFAHRMEMKLK